MAIVALQEKRKTSGLVVRARRINPDFARWLVDQAPTLVADPDTVVETWVYGACPGDRIDYTLHLYIID